MRPVPPPSPQNPHVPEPEPEPADDDEERCKVVGWRYMVLQVAGYDDPDALTIAHRLDIDLHHATDLLKHGCSVTMALEILL